ncbi:hypothetical protein LZ554_008299 [Drepanopeziza brunnea f. sp. 'monogermtubi']|nr:hypothetical protein LZ554_008299 [Drepanopeziza brunnea f. sp. 'monogermtubi']
MQRAVRARLLVRSKFIRRRSRSESIPKVHVIAILWARVTRALNGHFYLSIQRMRPLFIRQVCIRLSCSRPASACPSFSRPKPTAMSVTHTTAAPRRAVAIPKAMMS